MIEELEKEVEANSKEMGILKILELNKSKQLQLINRREDSQGFTKLGKK